MKLLQNLKKIDYRHFLMVVLTCYFLFCSYYYFQPVFYRVITSFKDFGLSIGYYFCVFLNIPNSISPTVKVIDETSKSILPFTYEEFVIKISSFWNLLFNKENITFYLKSFKKITYLSIKILMLLIPLFTLLFVILKNSLNKENNDYNKDTRPLKVYRGLVKVFIIPFKRWLNSLIEFVKENDKYIKIWLFIWLYNLNLITIIIEFFAFYFYFVSSYDFISIYIMVVKALIDLNVIFSFIPLWGWIIIGVFIIDIWRKSIAYGRLRHMEMKNRGFINSTGIVSMVVGTMGKKKTTTITDMVLSQEVMFRDKAFELLLENDLKFPYFPWINLENEIKRACHFHQIYNLATCKIFIRKKMDRFIKTPVPLKCFNYDFKQYGLICNDDLKISDLFDVLMTYTQLYFIYIIQSSLMVSNYSIREDNLISDLGNFPIWNTDFFKRDSRLIDSFSRHSHILDFDALRLGKKVLENNKKADSFEFGVVVITEIGKERGNMVELQGIKKVSYETNQKNDLFNSWLKLARHSATVDNFPFIKVITDDQRPESLGADARDLCQIVHIRDGSETFLSMPFFFIEELIYDYAFSRFINLYTEYRYQRSDNCLLMYLLKSIVSKIHSYYKRIYNRFSYIVLDLQIEQGTLDGNYKDKHYYLMSKKIYSKRFSTDCFSDIFNEKALRSFIGLEDLEEYITEKATFEELKKQNSYFINDLINIKDSGKMGKE